VAKTLDVIALGRAAVDLYGEQLGASLEDVQTFAKYIGGCAANIAVGTARLGLKTGMLTKLGDEHLGRFVRRTFEEEGVDTSQIKLDPTRLTGVVLLGIKSEHTFPLLFLRENVADMALAESDIDPAYIASSKTLVVTGTHFSQAIVDKASRAAMRHARQSGCKVVLDIDYRPVLWKVAGHGQGESRYVASDKVSGHLQSVVADCDLVVGTEEEFHIAGGSTDTLAALKTLRGLSRAAFVVKRGPLGCVIFEGAIPAQLEAGLVVKGLPVEVLNVLGAGDAFMAGFLLGYVRGEPLERCASYANACGALVVSRHGCAPAMPTRVELDDYLRRQRDIPRIDRDARLSHLHRVTTRRGAWPEICALAFDHRAQLEELADKRGADRQRLGRLKELIADGAVRAAEELGVSGRGVLVDDRYGKGALQQLSGRGFWIARPVEAAGSRPLAFEDGPDVSLTLKTRPREHVVKCLVFYHPDDDATLRAAQDASLRQLYRAAVALERELLLEVILPKGMPEDARTLARALEAIYGAGVLPDWWKLPPPKTREAWVHVSSAIEASDPHCRGVVLLGLEAPLPELQKSFALAAPEKWCKGFAVGRSIFNEPAGAWLSGTLDDAGLVAQVEGNFARVIELWRERA
jgi:5-dehydro-2-deoxygluconokinase